MAGPRKSDERETPPLRAALSRIEAALQAGLGAGASGARADLAREALRDGDPAPDRHLEAWLEAVAAELQSTSAALVPADMVEAIAARMIADPKSSLRAHGNVEGKAIRNLVRRP